MGFRRASGGWVLRQTGLTQTVMHFDTHMRDVGNLGDKLLVVVRGLGVVRHYRYNRCQVLRSHPLGRDAARIGRVTEEHPGRVFQRSRIGGLRVVEMLSGEQLPRIC